MSQGLDPNDLRDFSAIGLGWSIGLSLVVFILGGVFLDRWLGTTPWLTLAGVVVGLISAGYLLYELTLINRTDRSAGPVTRRLTARRRQRGRSTNNRVQGWKKPRRAVFRVSREAPGDRATRPEW